MIQNFKKIFRSPKTLAQDEKFYHRPFLKLWLWPYTFASEASSFYYKKVWRKMGQWGFWCRSQGILYNLYIVKKTGGPYKKLCYASAMGVYHKMSLFITTRIYLLQIGKIQLFFLFTLVLHKLPKFPEVSKSEGAACLFSIN